ncbi:MAG: LysR family transcriptional regulator [Rhodospirillaceae bacterium]|nr:LysR family transcriptional regulator [Rhodospirillaceae bacterium]
MRYLPEIEAIRSFSVVAEELNFRRAADRLGIDHSALSRRIRDLEHRLGFAVFARSTREVRLTEAWQGLLEENTKSAAWLASLGRSGPHGRGRTLPASFASVTCHSPPRIYCHL